jgi:hypothetical protein
MNMAVVIMKKTAEPPSTEGVTQTTETPTSVKKPVAAKSEGKRTFTQSSIGFPYRDLEAGLAVAQAIIGAGGVPLSSEQLAGVMNLQAGSGNFVMKLSTARMFGLVSNKEGKYGLTDIGFEIVDKDETRQKKARAEAFLTVPLYKRVYEEFRGKQLPPRPHGLEQAFVRFGVSEKQKTAARQIFDKSAAQAGFFLNGNDRLIEPIIGGVVARASHDEPEEYDAPMPVAPSAPARDLHPFVEGLLDTMPEPNTNWAIEGRAKWLQAAANIFDLMYKGSGEINISHKENSPKS